MRKRDSALAEALKGGQFAPPFALMILTAGGPQKLLCWNTEGIFRLIQSIPSPKAEPFKRWLARVGYERVQEIEDPELATKRTRALYRAKGYSDAWIERQMRRAFPKAKPPPSRAARWPATPGASWRRSLVAGLSAERTTSTLPNLPNDCRHPVAEPGSLRDPDQKRPAGSRFGDRGRSKRRDDQRLSCSR
jgi:hypothetical protein